MSKIAGVLKDFFAAHQQKVTQATAPGRLDVMGGVADVAGALLIQKAQPEVSTAYVAFRDDQMIDLTLIYQDEEQWRVRYDYRELIGQFPSVNYEYARQQVQRTHSDEVALSLIGCLLVLYSERGLKFEGIDAIIVSDIPLRAGVGATASCEIALLKAVSRGLNLSIGEYEIPAVAHQAENWVGGFTSGPGTHLACYAGHPSKLTPLVGSPSQVFHPISVPDSILLMGIDTGVPVSLADEAYGAMRAAMFMGYSIIALASGATVRDLALARETQDWSKLPYGGSIAAINPSEFEDKFFNILPESISGQEFFEKYQTSLDIISFIDRDKEYKVLSCTRHPVYENFRAKLFSQIIKNYTTEFQKYSSRLNLMGELMYQSHQSYVDCGISHPRADEIIAQVKEKAVQRGIAQRGIAQRGSEPGLYGARISGQGSGGTVIILCSGVSGPKYVQEIYEAYQRSVEKSVFLFK